MGYKKTDKCIEKAFDDERLFVLMARDNAAAPAIIDWIKYSLHSQPLSKLQEALECAYQMATEHGNTIRTRIMEEKILSDRKKHRAKYPETVNEKIRKQWEQPAPLTQEEKAELQKKIKDGYDAPIKTPKIYPATNAGLEQETRDRNLELLRTALEIYGPAMIHHEPGRLLQIKIENFENTLGNMARAGKLCVEHFPEFPHIAQCRVDTGIFHLTLKP